MSAPTPEGGNPAISATREWDVHLAAEIESKDRAYTFDMDDAPERVLLERFPKLAEALRLIERELLPQYEKANTAAITHQTNHTRLSKIAILGGVLAVCLAILQLALKQSVPALAGLAGWIEGVAVLGGLVAVGVGLWAKFDQQWFIQRHIAERLRMLKFQSLGQREYWCGSTEEWLGWVRARVSEIVAISDIKVVKKWAHDGSAEPVESQPGDCRESEIEIRAAAIYYWHKRVEFQAAYFKKQSARHRKSRGRFDRVGLPLFFTSIGAVILHFAAEHFAGSAGSIEAKHGWEIVGVWSLALAAILPVVGVGFRGWIGALERTRNAHLFDAKQRGLATTSKSVNQDQGDLAVTMHHIAHVEHFLEHEHREWLRLLLDAEWFL